jgi:putative two-component system response regulator
MMERSMQYRILIVDDEPMILEGILRSLHGMRHQWDICVAMNVDQALEMLASSKADVVISDISMPGRNGFELLAAIRDSADTKDLPVLMLTGMHEKGLKSQALDLGASDLLHKPFEKEDLVARIYSMLRLKEYQDQIRAQNEMLDQKVRERTAELERTRLELIWRLAKAAEHRDTDTGNHVVRVGFYSKALAVSLGMEKGFGEMIFLTGPLHDIGKIGIPDKVLLKRGPLTPEEWKVMKQHCKIGADILREDIGSEEGVFRSREKSLNGGRGQNGDPFIRMAANIALSHHERWDGRGYPSGCAKQDIPIESRIVSIADVFDSLFSARPYKPAYSEDRVLKIMREGKGSQFDPEVFEHFEKSIAIFNDIRHRCSDERVQSQTKPGASQIVRSGWSKEYGITKSCTIAEPYPST